MIRLLLKSLVRAGVISLVAFSAAWAVHHFSSNHEEGIAAWLVFGLLFHANVASEYIRSTMAFPPDARIVFPALLITFWFLVMLAIDGLFSALSRKRSS